MNDSVFEEFPSYINYVLMRAWPNYKLPIIQCFHVLQSNLIRHILKIRVAFPFQRVLVAFWLLSCEFWKVVFFINVIIKIFEIFIFWVYFPH